MEYFDYDALDEEYDRILEEADPCPNCGTKDDLALAVLTEIEFHGTIVLFCVTCDIDKKEDEISIASNNKMNYA